MIPEIQTRLMITVLNMLITSGVLNHKISLAKIMFINTYVFVAFING